MKFFYTLILATCLLVLPSCQSINVEDYDSEAIMVDLFKIVNSEVPVEEKINSLYNLREQAQLELTKAYIDLEIAKLKGLLQDTETNDSLGVVTMEEVHKTLEKVGY